MNMYKNDFVDIARNFISCQVRSTEIFNYIRFKMNLSIQN